MKMRLPPNFLMVFGGTGELRSQESQLALNLKRDSGCRERRNGQTCSPGVDTSSHWEQGFCCASWQIVDSRVQAAASRRVWRPLTATEIRVSPPCSLPVSHLALIEEKTRRAQRSVCCAADRGKRKSCHGEGQEKSLSWFSFIFHVEQKLSSSGRKAIGH